VVQVVRIGDQDGHHSTLNIEQNASKLKGDHTVLLGSIKLIKYRVNSKFRTICCLFARNVCVKFD
jgi:hypothetical protein